MKMFTLALVLTVTATTHANTINALNGDLYMGDEFVNERGTGHACYLYVDEISQQSARLHCYNLSVRPIFTTDRNEHPQDSLIVQGHITNAHRSEYPKIKTCASSLDGKTSGQDIYSQDTKNIYNHLFSWAGLFNGAQYDLFVTNSSKTKQPSRVRLHKLTTLSEKNYDCVNLKKM
ncbi:MAG: hypothetical protein ACK4VO_11320 [Pseudobdellovibrio sp.]